MEDHKHFRIPTDHNGVSLLTDGTDDSSNALVAGILADCPPDSDTDTNRYAQVLANAFGLGSDAITYGNGQSGKGSSAQAITRDPSSWPVGMSGQAPTRDSYLT